MDDETKPPIAIDLAPLLAPGAPARAAVVGGARVGDVAEVLRGLPLTGAEPRAPQAVRGGETFALLADGTEVPWPLSARVESVLADGGWVRAADVAWRVEDGRVARIAVRGAGLAGLGIHAREDIERRFGVADGVERTSPERTDHHYLARDVTLCWDARRGSLECLLLGGVTWVDASLTGRDLAVQLAEAQHRLERYGWAEPPIDDRGATVRYQRLRALGAALGLPGVAALVDGSFFGAEHDARCAALVERLRTAGGHEPGRAPFPTSPARLYQDLLRYRRNAQALLEHNAGWLECADMAQVAIIATTGRVNEELAERLRPVEDLLGELLDPAQRRIPRSALVRDWGYPDVEPEVVDLAEQCEP